jgi:hypothetical protein
MKKFFAIFAVALLALVGCDKEGKNNKGNGSNIDGQWHLVTWNGEAPEFDVYVEYKDGEFDIYQQVYTIYYEHFEGDYVINDNIVTGSYADGKMWACGYKYSVEAGVLTMHSQEDISVTSIYEKCEIPQAVIDEATSTRASETTPFL